MLGHYNDGFFNVNPQFGFLPIKDPLKTLPNKYNILQNLINDLPIIKNTNGEIERRVGELPLYEINEDDIFVIQALYRAYTFVASMYLLEPSYQYFKIHNKYGKGKTFLPKNVSIPLVYVSEKLNVYPWLDYHYAYSLGNYVRKDINGSLNWSNLDMACKFSGTSDEIGFIMIHVYINELSPKLIKTAFDICNNNNFESLKINYQVLKEMNSRRREMWKASNHKNYNDFRIFIMGIKGNDEIFGDGVVYEDCFNNEPQQFRGQTGAQDDIIPMEDILTGIINYYPQNELTKYLLELRTYRPKVIQNFFTDLCKEFDGISLKDRLLQSKKYDDLVYLLGIIDEIYMFRNGHWQFVQKYIMENTKYPKATGGTPIISWIPNQIGACLQAQVDLMKVIDEIYDELDNEIRVLFDDLKKQSVSKCELLRLQIKELNENAQYDIELIYDLNTQMKLEDSKLC